MRTFAFVKTMVQTRAKGHTAIGAVCYRYGLAATSTLETPVREWPSEFELQAFEAAEDRRLAEAKRNGTKTQRRKLRPKLLRMDPPRHYDYRGRVGLVGSGAALPEGAAPQWCDPLEWARRVEAADGKRLDSRQCRDDIVGIPLELVQSGFADLAIARQAAKIAELHQTPVHWVIHRPHGNGLNWHAHMLYAGRRLSSDGHGFDQRRDTAQDKRELIEDHKELWAQTCREFGVEITFALPGQAIEDEVIEEFTAERGCLPTSKDAHAVQAEKNRRWKEHRRRRPTQHPLTPKVLRAERDAVAEEEGHRLDAVIQAAGGTPLSSQDRRALGRLSSGVEDLDTAQLLALERVPLTVSARIAKYGRPTPTPGPAHQVEPPRPIAAPALTAPPVAAHALPQPPLAATVGVVLPAPVPAREVSLVPPAEFLSRAGLLRPPPVAPQRIMRPPQPVPQSEEVLAAPVQHLRPDLAPELICVAPRPPWRQRLRRIVNSLRRTAPEWWPWSPTPPRPMRRLKVRVPKHLRRPARPVPAPTRRLEAPTDLARPTPAIRPILLQHPDNCDFNPVTKSVTLNAQAREREARARVRVQPARGPRPTPPGPTLPPAPTQTRASRPKSKRRRGYDGGIGY